MSKRMIKIVLIDDENDALEALEWKIRKCRPNENFNIVKCSSPVIASDIIREINPDIVFLDIQMLEMDGFTFLNNFPNRGFDVVFTTAHDEYGVKAVKANALDYLLKPVDLDELQLTFEKAKKRFYYKKREVKVIDKINISADGKVYLVDKKDVVYLKADKSYTTIFLTEERRIVATKTLKEVQKKFAFPEFYRVHNSYVINLNCVTEYNRGSSELTLIDGTVVSVSRRKKNELVEMLQLDK
ncbi:conserved hypothetical protein [Tenacibaculum xiamenense]